MVGAAAVVFGQVGTGHDALALLGVDGFWLAVAGERRFCVGGDLK